MILDWGFVETQPTINTKRMGYVKAAKIYYADYSKLIGEPYQPSKAYLRAMSAVFSADQKPIKAKNLLDLANALYPEGSNALPPPPPGGAPPPPPPGTGVPPPPPPGTGG